MILHITRGFWVATKLMFSAGFYLQEDRTDPNAWSNILDDILKGHGFP